MGVGGQRHAPAALPPRKTRYPYYTRLGGPQGGSGGVRKISLPPGFDPQTVQPVASRHIDCAIPAHSREVNTFLNSYDRPYHLSWHYTNKMHKTVDLVSRISYW